MKKNLFTNVGVNLVLAVALAACGSSSSGPSNSQNGNAMTLNATALNNKTVVAAAPKSKVETMLAFLGSKEAVAAVSTNCADPAKEFDLAGTPGVASVCLETALLVYEEIELEVEGNGPKDKFERGPFIVDLVDGTTDISGSISLDVPSGRFNKLELKVGDLDDRNGNGSLDDDSSSSSSSGDDFPIGIDPTVLNNAGMANKSLKITGTANDGAGNTTAFSFFTDIEGKLEMPISLVNGEQLVVDGSTLVTFIDLSTGFKKLAFADITPTMDGSFSGSTERCSTTANKSRTLACDIVKNVELYHDHDGPGHNSFDDSERRGDSRGARGFDDSGSRD